MGNYYKVQLEPPDASHYRKKEKDLPLNDLPILKSICINPFICIYLRMDFRSVENGFKQPHESIYARIKVISGITQLSQKNKTNTPIAYNEIWSVVA